MDVRRPCYPILQAYIGDPVRIRLVHAAVKETHVFHLNLYEWHAVPQDTKSPRIDVISISPQSGHTIEHVWGAGNRHQVAGDVIWHYHLYPHFHEGMWGIFRTLETRQYGRDGKHLQATTLCTPVVRSGATRTAPCIDELLPLPGTQTSTCAEAPAAWLSAVIPGTVRQKSPRPPWPDRELAYVEKPCN